MSSAPWIERTKARTRLEAKGRLASGDDVAADSDIGSPDMGVNKVSWEKVGRVAEPGRYMYTFGWLTITAEDLDIWKKFPNAKFTLVVQPSTEASLGEEEYRLGAFDVSPDT